MKTYRRFLCGLVVLMLLGTLLLCPAIRWRLLGWLGNEAFYHGRPTSYWSAELGNWREEYFAIMGVVTEPIGWRRQPTRWETWMTQHLGLDPGNVRQKAPPLANGDLAALPVLLELLQSSDLASRRGALRGLRALGPQGKVAVPAVMERLHSADGLESKLAIVALGAIGPEAKPAFAEILERFRCWRQERNFFLTPDERDYYSQQLADALYGIDPTAAEGAGVPRYIWRRW